MLGEDWDLNASETTACDQAHSAECIGLDPYARAFVTFLLYPPPDDGHGDADPWPARSISIEGGWGVGKSTFTRLVAAQLRAKNVPVVTFRPWVHANADDLWAALANTFYRDVKQQLPYHKYVRRMFVLWWKRWFRRGAKRDSSRYTSILPLLIVLVALNLFVWSGGHVWLTASISGLLSNFSNLANRIAAIFTTGVALFIAATKLIPYLAMLLTRNRRLSTPPLVSRLEGDFSELVSALCPAGKPEDRAVIFIDDLDRCTGLGVAETLRAIGVLINERVNVTVVMAIDRDRVAAALATEDKTAEYHSFGATAYDNAPAENGMTNSDNLRAIRHGHYFLEKFIEATFRLPSLSDLHAARILDRTQYGQSIPKRSAPVNPDVLQKPLNDLCNDYLDIVLKLFEGNPRRLKLWRREVYLHLLILHELNRFEPESHRTQGRRTRTHIALGQTARLHALMIRWPRFLGDLRRHPRLLQWIVACAKFGNEWEHEWGLGVILGHTPEGRHLTYWAEQLRHHPQMVDLLLDEGDSTASSIDNYKPSLFRLQPELFLELQDVQIDEEPEAATSDTQETPPTPNESTQEIKKAPDPNQPIAPSINQQDNAPAELGRRPLDTEQALRNLMDVGQIPGPFLQSFVGAHSRALAALRDAGPTSEEYSGALNRLGSVLYEAGCYPAAFQVREQELTINRLILGAEHPDVASSMNNLANVLIEMGDLRRAQEIHEQVLGFRQRILGPKHPGVAISMNNLANVLHERGELQRAQDMHAQALELRLQILEPEHSDIANSMNNLANVLRDQGDLVKAKNLYEQAIAIQKRALGPDHPNLAKSMSNLANVLGDQGSLREAAKLYRKTFEIQRRILGLEHPETASCINNLGVSLHGQGDLQQARKAYEQALELRLHILGREHPDVASSMDSLANVMCDLGELQRARELHEQALNLRQHALGSEHPDVARSIDNLANVFKEQGKLRQANELYKKSLGLRRRILGPEHQDTARSMNNLAEVLHAQGDLTQAQELYERSFRLGRPALGTEHPDIAHSKSNMARVLHDQGEQDRSLEQMEEAFDLYLMQLGNDHPSTLLTAGYQAWWGDRGNSKAYTELGALLRRVLKQVPAIAKEPVLLGRMFKDVGGDPISEVREVVGEEVAKQYEARLNGPEYPGP